MRFLKVLTLGILLLASSHCSKKSDAERGLVYNIRDEPPTLDWNRIEDILAAQLLGNLISGMVQYVPEDKELTPRPLIATRWELSPDGKTYTFFLRSDATWHDGVKVTAQHFKDSWLRLLDPATAAPYAYFLFDIVGAQDFNGSKGSKEAVGIEVVDPLTIRVKLKNKIPYFPHLLAHHTTYPIRLDLIEKYGDQWTEAGKFIGNGPYTLKSWVHEDKMVLEAYENYWEKKATIKTVNVIMVREDSTAITLFETGKLDVHPQDLIPTEIPRLAKQYPQEFFQASTLGNMYVSFNVRKAPFNNVFARRAIAHAIDSNELAKILQGGEMPTKSFIPPGMMGHNPNIGLPFDATKAKDYLKKAGYGPSKPFPKITIFYNTNDRYQVLFEFIQAELKKHLNIDVALRNTDRKTFFASLKTLSSKEDSPDIFRQGWFADYPDPSNFMTIMLSDSGQNNTGWKNARYDALTSDAGSTLDEAQRRKKYDLVQKLLLEEEAVVLPLYFSSQQTLISKRTKDVWVNPLLWLPLNRASWRDAGPEKVSQK